MAIKKTSQTGFMIVELIVAIVVAGVIIGAANLVIVNYTHLSYRSRDLLLANSYVEGKVEQIRNNGYKSLTDGTTSLTSELPSELKSPRSASMTVSDYATGIKQVDISVSYNDQGANRTYSYTTYVGELGVGQY